MYPSHAILYTEGERGKEDCTRKQFKSSDSDTNKIPRQRLHQDKKNPKTEKYN